MLLWGIQGPGRVEDGDVVRGESEDEDEDLISLLTMFLEEGEEWDRQQEIQKMRMNKGIQTNVSDWFTVTRIERKKKVEPEKTVTKELRQTNIWQCLEVKKQGQVGDGEITGLVKL